MNQVDIGGGRTLAYEEQGNGPPIVLLHGVPGRRSNMAPLAGHLSATHRVIAMDLPGYGDSARPVDWSLESMAADVVDALDALELTDVFVLGHSMGAVVAAQVATMSPFQVGYLGLVACIGARPHQSLRAAGIPFEDLHRRIQSGDRKAALDEAEAHFRRIHFLGMSRGECEATVGFIARLDFEAIPEMLERLSVPTLVAFAEDDPSIEAEIREVLRKWAPPGLRMNWPSGGHAIHKTRAREIAAGILSLA